MNGWIQKIKKTDGLIAEMFIPNSNYWNVAYGSAAGGELQDEESMQIMRVLGKNMAWLLKTKETFL